ncbi:MAG: glutamate--tRNA ligase [Deferribacterota bacterium]|nr:glutamate--tRNA ligase [Deferribacterota bacterium]
MTIRVRFAPSPTGHLHIGNARTAVFNYLFARSHKGAFILRIEDTDLERSTIESENMIYDDLRWLNLSWDEGPIKDGSFGPYRQSERLDLYRKYIKYLIDHKKAYLCFCSKVELENEKEDAIKKGIPYIYSGRCRNLTDGEVEERLKANIPYSVRIKCDQENILVNDIIHGEINFNTNAFGDFIIVRPNGMPIYNFVVVVDDALMKISHVIRGDDHLSNTPKQILIYKSLGFSPPQFAHIPMILGKNGSKLSKREGSMSVASFREVGYLPEAVFNYLALLGYSPPNGKEYISQEELINFFDIKDVSKSAAIFDFDKLKWLNGLYIRDLDIEKLTNMVVPYLLKGSLIDETIVEKEPLRLRNIVESVRDNLTTLSDITKYAKIYFIFDKILDEALDFIVKENTLNLLEEVLNILGGFKKRYLDEEDFQYLVNSLKKKTKLKGRKLFMSLRVAISGKMDGPELKYLYTNIEIAELRRRIKIFIETLKERDG